MSAAFVGVEARFWRMLSIRWQREPLRSGSHRTGGRWNAHGVKALYLASDHSTAIAEFYRSLIRPGTLAAYDVRSDAIVDLTDAATQNDIGADPTTLTCDWQTIYAIQRQTPPSWVLADKLIAGGAEGALVPSVQHRGGTNLVLWRWGDDGGAEVRVIDPERDLG